MSQTELYNAPKMEQPEIHESLLPIVSNSQSFLLTDYLA